MGLDLATVCSQTCEMRWSRGADCYMLVDEGSGRVVREDWKQGAREWICTLWVEPCHFELVYPMLSGTETSFAPVSYFNFIFSMNITRGDSAPVIGNEQRRHKYLCAPMLTRMARTATWSLYDASQRSLP